MLGPLACSKKERASAACAALLWRSKRIEEEAPTRRLERRGAALSYSWNEENRERIERIDEKEREQRENRENRYTRENRKNT